MPDDRRGAARPGNSYNDPAYAQIEAGLEKRYGLPDGLLSRIRTRGERSNSDQVSSAGARSVYQIIPSTRAAFVRKYGVDAYSSPEAAAQVAALHLRDDYIKTKSWDAAVTRYIGGPDPSKWGAQTVAYTKRVTGSAPAGDPRDPTPDLPPLPDVNGLDLMNTRPDQFDYARRPLPPQSADPDHSKEAKRLAKLTSLLPTGIAGPQAVSNTPDLTQEIQEQDAGTAAEAKRAALANPKATPTNPAQFAAGLINPVIGLYNQTSQLFPGFTSRLDHAADEEWLLPQLARTIDNTVAAGGEDPGYDQWYQNNREDIESFALTPAERQQLRETYSRAGLAAAKKDIEHSRANREAIDATGHGTFFSLTAGLSDPAGWVAGAGVGKGFEIAGLGSRALLAEGRTGAAVASLGAEGAVGNLAFTGMLNAAGKTTTTEDYAMAGGQGFLIGLGLSPFMLRGRADIETPKLGEKFVEEAQAQAADKYAQAVRNLGEDATPDAIKAEVERLDAAQYRSWITTSLAPVPDSDRILLSDPDKMLTADPAVKADVTGRYGFDATIADDTEKALVTEMTAKSEQIVASNPIDAKATDTLLNNVGMESTGLRLLRSESPVGKAIGISLLESTTGAAGRRRTAAMSMKVRERMYNRIFYPFDDLYHQFRRSEGAGLVSEFVSGRQRRRFNERVFDEVEARADSPEGQYFDESPHVREAADLWERGMNAMRREMQHVGTVGAARLGTTSRGYMRHVLDARKVVGLTNQQRGRVIEELSAQFMDPTNGFDAAFSKRLATKYLERAEDAAKGGFDVPMNLRNPEAADVVYDALKALSIPDMEIEKLMGKFSRGGADFTKQRLRLKLDADLGDGMKLRDLFNSDISSLYRGYARRAAGEVALGQYGIMGKKGLNELRKALSATGGSVDDLKAFDQIAAEFLNSSFGEHNHRYMDNMRVATSVARLGGMGFTQFAEYGNALSALGIHRTFAAIGALPRMVREVGQLAKGGEPANPILASIDTLGGHIGLDEYNLTRMFDVKDNDIQVYSTDNLGIASRGLRGIAHIQAGLTGQRMITAVQTRAMAEQIVRKAIQYIKDGTESVALADMGVSPELAGRLRADLPNIATFDGAGKLDRLDLLKSKMEGTHVMEFRDAIERGSSQIIQRTYIGETGKWAHNGLLKMLLQFRTFGVTSVEKQWGRGVHNYGAIKASMYLLGAMSFAVPIHIARVQAKMLGMSRSEREKYADQNLTVPALARATINYASASGLLGDVLDIGGGFASGLGGDGGKALAQNVGVRGTKGQNQLLGGVVAPGVGLVEDVWDGVHGNGKKLVDVLPGSNLPYVQPIINGVTADDSSQKPGASQAN